ncbi:hypothetical protein, partial [Pseudomonas syringae group genomosp. 7]|uniref:hypothetical protein n=1 Tax=Pseudomonas syringae group genomosp. 7 TaxID=251699 RepID=UPI00376FD76E
MVRFWLVLWCVLGLGGGLLLWWWFWLLGWWLGARRWSRFTLVPHAPGGFAVRAARRNTTVFLRQVDW